MTLENDNTIAPSRCICGETTVAPPKVGHVFNCPFYEPPEEPSAATSVDPVAEALDRIHELSAMPEHVSTDFGRAIYEIASQAAITSSREPEADAVAAARAPVVRMTIHTYACRANRDPDVECSCGRVAAVDALIAAASARTVGEATPPPTGYDSMDDYLADRGANPMSDAAPPGEERLRAAAQDLLDLRDHLWRSPHDHEARDAFDNLARALAPEQEA